MRCCLIVNTFSVVSVNAQLVPYLSSPKAIRWPTHVTIQVLKAVILLPAHPAFFTQNFVSGMQSFYFSESQDAIVLQICHEE